MANHSSATAREPHVTNSNTNKTSNFNGRAKGKISNALRRRAQAVLNDRSINSESRAWIRYGLEINDPWLGELVRRVDAGETIVDRIDFSETSANGEDDSSKEKVEALSEIICRPGDEPETKSAALLVLMATLENAQHSKVLANTAKHAAFAHCAELNLYGMVDAQIALLEGELLA